MSRRGNSDGLRVPESAFAGVKGPKNMLIIVNLFLDPERENQLD